MPDKIHHIPETGSSVVVVRITRKQTNDDVAIDSLRQKLRSIDADKIYGVVIDLEEIDMLPSEVMGMFIELHRRASFEVRLCNVHPAIREILTRTRLIRMFSVFRNEEGAVANLAASSTKSLVNSQE